MSKQMFLAAVASLQEHFFMAFKHGFVLTSQNVTFFVVVEKLDKCNFWSVVLCVEPVLYSERINGLLFFL